MGETTCGFLFSLFGFFIVWQGCISEAESSFWANFSRFGATMQVAWAPLKAFASHEKESSFVRQRRGKEN